MTTAKEDIKYVKNLAKDAEGLTETQISELETVSEEDMAKFPEGEIIQPIAPEKALADWWEKCFWPCRHSSMPPRLY